MNENLNLVEILKDCPKGTKLYSTVFGEVEFNKIDTDYRRRPIRVSVKNRYYGFTKDGRLYYDYDGECMLFPSREQRDWSKFNSKKPKFDPKTLQPFDKVVVSNEDSKWKCGLFSHIIDSESKYKYSCIGSAYEYCIPYNYDTKHLVGTTKKAPEFYRYWED